MERKVNQQSQADVDETFSIGGVQTFSGGDDRVSDKRVVFDDVVVEVEPDGTVVCTQKGCQKHEDVTVDRKTFCEQPKSSRRSSTPAQDSGEYHSDPTCPTTLCRDHVEGTQQGRLDRGHRVPGGDSTIKLDNGGTQVSVVRAQGGEWDSKQLTSSALRSSGVDHQAQQGCHQEGQSSGILPEGLGSQHLWRRDHRSAETCQLGEDLHDHEPTSIRWRGIWSPRELDLRRDQVSPTGVLPVGENLGGGRWMQLPPDSLGPLVGNGTRNQCQEDDAKGDSPQREKSHRSQPQPICCEQHVIPGHGHDDQDGAYHRGIEGRGGTSQGGQAAQEVHRGCDHATRRCAVSSEPMAPRTTSSDALSLAVDMSSADETICQRASDSMARFLEKQSLELAPQAFQSLVSHGDTFLVEVACSPESRLSAEVQKLFGSKDAAVRCSHWNECDLGSSAGVKKIIDVIQCRRPRHVWISPDCGPYSPMQAINQKTEAQVQALQDKRRAALKQYIGASCIVHHCIQQGIHVSWEWAQFCQGWRLPFMQKLISKYDLYFGVTQGCRVGLRDPKTQSLLKKGWKVMSTSKKLAETMNMPCLCPKGYNHAKCEGSLTGLTAYYTKDYVKRVVQCMVHELSHNMVLEEMSGQTVLPQTFGEGPVCVCEHLRDHGGDFQCGACYMEHNKFVYGSDFQSVDEHAHVQHFVGKMTPEEIDKKLYLLHAATGHGSVRNMVHALERRKASPEVIEAAKRFTCSVCQEKQRVNFKHVASIEPLPPKFSVVSADGGKFVHPHTQEECEFACVIDEGSRFRIARILKHGKKQTMNAGLFIQYFREGWMQYFGCPNTLRLDPAGAFRSQELERFCDDNSIFLDVIPGEAHWFIGTCEQAVQGLKVLMEKLILADHGMTVEEALAESARVFNHREMVRGYSPVQHVLGRAPDETGRFVHSLCNPLPETLLENPNGEFERNVERMKQAEQALSEWQAQQKVTKALNSKGQRLMDYRPGDLIYYWRKQIKGEPAHKNGKFLGPARILATESKRDPDGTLRKGSAAWCVRGRRVIKCCVEQLRPASKREELLEHLGEGEPEAPWTFPRITQELGGNEYEDVSMDAPALEDWEAAQDPMIVEPAARRHSTKRPPTPRQSHAAPQPSPSKASRSSGSATAHVAEPREEAWWSLLEKPLPETSEGSGFWDQQHAAVTIEVPLPDSHRGLLKAVTDFEGFFVGALKRRAVEVHEKHLTPAERLQFKEAKDAEVRNFIAAKAFEALPPELQPDKSQAIGMRWLLTWKLKEDGERKAKARAILQGYQDPSYEHRATTTPVMTRMTRQLLLHEAARNKWRVRKGDVTGAFLQGREYPQTLYCTPCAEICEAMGLKAGEITKIKRGCYGLVDAPLEWYRTICEYLEELGLEKSWSDPCCWLWKPNGVLRGMIAGHVDDFLFTGPADDPAWQEIERKIQQKYKWTDWEENSFVQCGVLIEAQKDGSFCLSQPKYLEKVSEINLSAMRRKDANAPTTEKEKSLLRAVLGAVSWHAQQVAPHFSAEVGLLLSDVTVSTVETIHQTNRLLQRAKSRKDHKLVIHSFPKGVELGMFCWADAAGQNRRDGGSTQGIFVGIAPMNLLNGGMEKITPISWHAGKIDKVTRSPGAAEARAVVNGEDVLFHARFQYGEMLSDNPNVFDVNHLVNVVPGCVISDS